MSRTVRILLVEDNPADADLTQESLASDRLSLEVTVARDGAEALEMLRREGPFATMKLPDLIVLDLNLPRVHGDQVLEVLRATEDLKMIPVVVLTSSDAERDIVRSYKLGANCYVKKPMNLQAFQEIVKSVEDFWFTIVKLPPVPGRA